MPPAAFSVRGNRVLLCMEICKELRYNFDVESKQKIAICGIGKFLYHLKWRN